MDTPAEIGPPTYLKSQKKNFQSERSRSKRPCAQKINAGIY
jgi:hypothetical protein